MTASPGKMKAIWPWYTQVDHGHMTCIIKLQLNILFLF